MSYSLIRSRTFWTLMFMVATDVIAAYGNLFTPDTLAVINLALTSLASYFHLQTGKSTTGQN